MDPMKEVGGAVVLLFMLLGAVDLIVVGALVMISSIVSGPASAIVGGAILLALGGGIAYLFWRSI
jgi:hypothetical protein